LSLFTLHAVITAGSAQKPGESRLDLVHRNIAILDSILKELRPLDPESIILVIANPVDVLTWYAQQHSGLPKNQVRRVIELSSGLNESLQVFGSGTYLDTTRLRVALGMKLQVADSSIHTFVLGEHGDSQFPAFSWYCCELFFSSCFFILCVVVDIFSLFLPRLSLFLSSL
jgi:L-lactate dehydrogenase